MRPLIGVFLFATSVLAGTIYDNGTPLTDPNLACRPSCPEITTSVGGSVFRLLSDADVTGFEFWTFQLPGAYSGGTLMWQISTDNSGSPASRLDSGTFTLSQDQVQSNVSVAGFGPLIEYSNVVTTGSLSANPLHAQQDYYLDISDTSGVDKVGIFWATSGPGALAFQIDGTSDIPINDVPEPATGLLFASGLLCILAGRSWFLRRASI